MKTNLGLLFNKEYFKAFNYSGRDKWSMDNNHYAIDKVLKSKLDENYSPSLSNHSFKLKTIYPGLLSGSGYTHDVGKIDNEFRLGFYFDHTTGLPVIPASSVKGVLRHACEMRDGAYLEDILSRLNINNKTFNPKEFVDTVFKGDEKDKGISIYQRDIFLEAFPVHSSGTLLGDDYITPHKEPLTNPVPIKFLRVQPEVVYEFHFRLTDSNGLSAEQKAQVFQEVIKDLGVGAKTNVGYGQFVSLNEKEKQSTAQQIYRAYTPSKNAIDYKKNEIVIMTIKEVGEYVILKDEVGSEFMKKKNKFKGELKVGTDVKVKFNADLTNLQPNYKPL